jgi:hypothetical protein
VTLVTDVMGGTRYSPGNIQVSRLSFNLLLQKGATRVIKDTVFIVGNEQNGKLTPWA